MDRGAFVRKCDAMEGHRLNGYTYEVSGVGRVIMGDLDAYSSNTEPNEEESFRVNHLEARYTNREGDSLTFIAGGMLVVLDVAKVTGQINGQPATRITRSEMVD